MLGAGLTLKEMVRGRLQELDAGPKKSLGQNFLIHRGTVDRIVAAATALKSTAFVEVGPGAGSLTETLILQKAQLQVIELDRAFAAYWRDKRGVTTVEADALNLNWQELNLPPDWALVSNLPYQISSSLVIERTLQPLNCGGMILMFQKEVAARITAQPSTPDYGLLSVMSQPFWRIDKVCDVPPTAFWPAPKISSRVLRFVPRTSTVTDRQGFLKMLKAVFAHRRKQMRKAFSAWAQSQKWQHADRILQELGVPDTVRAEEISVVYWEKIFTQFTLDVRDKDS